MCFPLKECIHLLQPFSCSHECLMLWTGKKSEMFWVQNYFRSLWGKTHTFFVLCLFVCVYVLWPTLVFIKSAPFFPPRKSTLSEKKQNLYPKERNPNALLTTILKRIKFIINSMDNRKYKADYYTNGFQWKLMGHQAQMCLSPFFIQPWAALYPFCFQQRRFTASFSIIQC